jgi:protein YIPF1/2
MKIFGSDPSFPTLLCIYGYSFSSYIPISLLCTIPNSSLHVIAIGWGVFVSTSFLIVNIWKDLANYMQSRKYFIIFIVVLFQLIIYLVMVLYFFGLQDKLESKIQEIQKIIVNENTSSSTSASG